MPRISLSYIPALALSILITAAPAKSEWLEGTGTAITQNPNGVPLTLSSANSLHRITFHEYLRTVSENNIPMLAERLNIDVAEAEALAAKVLPDPELYFEGGEEQFVIELGYTFETGGKRRKRVALALSEARAEELAFAAFLNELRAEAADAYLEAILKREMLEMTRSSYEYMRQLSVSDSLRHAAGEITLNEARQSWVEAMGLLNEVYAAEGEYMTSLVDLSTLMGDNYPGVILREPTDRWEVLTAFDYTQADLVETGLSNRPEIALASQMNETSLRALQLVKAERKPDFEVMVGFERDWHGFFPKRDMLKAGITIPLQFSNTNKGALRSARHSIRQSELIQSQTEQEIRSEITKAHYQYLAISLQAANYHSGILEESRKVLEGIDYMYRRGESDVLELLVAQRTYNEVQQDYLEVMKEYAAAIVELRRSAGIL